MSDRIPPRRLHFKDAMEDLKSRTKSLTPIGMSPLSKKSEESRQEGRIQELIAMMDELWEAKQNLEQMLESSHKENDVLKATLDLEVARSHQLHERLETCRAIMSDEIQAAQSRMDKKLEKCEHEKEQLKSDLAHEKMKTQHCFQSELRTFFEGKAVRWRRVKFATKLLRNWAMHVNFRYRRRCLLMRAQYRIGKYCVFNKFHKWIVTTRKSVCNRQKDDIHSLGRQVHAITELKEAHETRAAALLQLQVQTELCLDDGKVSNLNMQQKHLKLLQELEVLKQQIATARIRENQHIEMKKNFERALVTSDKMHDNTKKENGLLREALDALKNQFREACSERLSNPERLGRGNGEGNCFATKDEQIETIQRNLDSVLQEKISLDIQLKLATSALDIQSIEEHHNESHLDRIKKAVSRRVFSQWMVRTRREQRQRRGMLRFIQRMQGGQKYGVIELWKHANIKSKIQAEQIESVDITARQARQIEVLERELQNANRLKEAQDLRLSMTLEGMQQLQDACREYRFMSNELATEKRKCAALREWMEQSKLAADEVEIIIESMSHELNITHLNLKEIQLLEEARTTRSQIERSRDEMKGDRLAELHDAQDTRINHLVRVQEQMTLTLIELQTSKDLLEEKLHTTTKQVDVLRSELGSEIDNNTQLQALFTKVQERNSEIQAYKESIESKFEDSKMQQIVLEEGLQTYKYFHSCRFHSRTKVHRYWTRWKTRAQAKRRQILVIQRWRNSEVQLCAAAFTYWSELLHLSRELRKKDDRINLLEQQIVSISVLKDTHEASVMAMLALQKQMEDSSEAMQVVRSRLEDKLGELENENDALKAELSALSSEMENSDTRARELWLMKSDLDQTLSLTKAELEKVKMSSAIKRWKKSNLVRPWNHWTLSVSKTRKVRQLLLRCVEHLRGGLRARSFDLWAQRCMEERLSRNSRELIDELEATKVRLNATCVQSDKDAEKLRASQHALDELKVVTGNLESGFTASRKDAENLKAMMKNKQMHWVMKFWTTVTVRGPWNYWKALPFEKRRKRQLVAQSLRRFCGGTKMHYYGLWLEHWKWQKAHVDLRQTIEKLGYQLLDLSKIADAQESRILVLTHENSQIQILMQKLEISEIARAELERVNRLSMISLNRSQQSLEDSLKALQETRDHKQAAEIEVSLLQRKISSILSLKTAAAEVLEASSNFEEMLKSAQGEKTAGEAQVRLLERRLIELSADFDLLLMHNKNLERSLMESDALNHKTNEALEMALREKHQLLEQTATLARVQQLAEQSCASTTLEMQEILRKRKMVLATME